MSKERTSPKTEGFTLAQLVESTAAELRVLRDMPLEDDPVMGFKSCEIELSVTVKAEAGGGFRFWVVEASGKATGETVSKIKLQFAALEGENRRLVRRAGPPRGGLP